MVDSPVITLSMAFLAFDEGGLKIDRHAGVETGEPERVSYLSDEGVAARQAGSSAMLDLFYQFD